MKLNKAEKFVKKFQEDNPNYSGSGCITAIEEKLFGGSYQDKYIPPEYRKAVRKFYSIDMKD